MEPSAPADPEHRASSAVTIFTTDGALCWHRGDGALIVSLAGDLPRIGAAVLDALERAVEA